MTEATTGLGPLEKLQAPEARRSTEAKATMRPLTFTVGGETVSLRILTISEGKPFAQFAGGKLADLLDTSTTGDALVALGRRLMASSAEEMIDLVLRYDLDEVIPREVDDEAGLLRSSWFEDHATLEEVEGAFLGVLTVAIPFGRRLRRMIDGGSWSELIRTIVAMYRESQATPSPTPTR